MPRAHKTTLFVALVVFSNTFGNLCLSLGMKGSGSGLVASLVNPWVLAGIALLVLWTFSRMALLSWADLSYVLPVTSLGYVLNAILGRLVQHEAITWERWLGTLLIVAGTALVGATPPAAGPRKFRS
jgi:uncharacterized membrane protein